MADYISKEIREATEALAKLIRADKRYQEYEAAAKAYEGDAEVLAMITEYNVHQTALSDQFGKQEREEQMIIAIQKRIDELYEMITTNESYQNFVRAKEESDAFVKMVNAELEFFLTGHRPCSHDCSTCHADCSGAQGAQNDHHHEH